MKVLIITKSDDNESIAFVTDAITARGGTVLRFDTDRFPTEVGLLAEYSKTSARLTLIDKEREFDLSDLSAVWYRRLNVGAMIPATMAAELRTAAVLESRTTVLGFIASIEAFHLDQIRRVHHANNKQLQLQVARSLGLETPRTLITNSPAAVQAFANACEAGIITKMLSSFAIYEKGEEKVVFTNSVSRQDLEELDGLRYAPMTFQEKVPKMFELRVTIVGYQIFAAAIDSQSSERAIDDWRRDGVALLDAWQPYELPPAVEEKLLKLMDYFGLNYGAIDIIVTPDGRYVFLEINPAGEFFWLEQNPGLPISQALAELLLGTAARRA